MLLISNIASDILRRQGPQVVQAALNNILDNIRDQQIDDRHRENFNDMDKISHVIKGVNEFSDQPG